MKKPLALIIMDGFGLRKETEGNAIAAAKQKLEQASHKFAERIYKDAASAQQGAGPDAGAQNSGGAEQKEGDKGGKVYDADYEVVDENK